MPFIAIDHNIHRHPKFRDMPDIEFVIWHTGLCYAAEFWTNGFVPASEFPKKNQQKFVFDLVERNLWAPIVSNGVTGYQIHDYLKYQTSKAHYEAKHEADRLRKRKNGIIPSGIHDGISQDSKRNPEGIPALREEKRTEEKTTVPWGSSGRPTPVPPQFTDKDIPSNGVSMPDEVKAFSASMKFGRSIDVVSNESDPIPVISMTEKVRP
jgi:hypothetical protein